MLATWMLYCAAVGVLLSVGALALEHGLRSLGRPTRWVWAGAMALTLALPAAVRLLPARRPAPEAASVISPAPRTRGTPAPLAAKTQARRPAPPTLDLGGWDPALRLAWGASSAAVLLGLATMAGVLAFRRRGWSATVVDGVPVLVSHDVGPAVVGLFRSRIVLPAWTLAADEEARRLVLEHEREHVRAGDPRLLAAAFLFAALTPWNPAAWWQLRRLRLALEVDCDARVLRRRADVRAYGSVLIEVGRRASRTRLAAAAFAEPVSSLERRIRIMTAPRVRRPLLHALTFGALAAALVAAACETPGPTQPSPGGGRRLYAAEGEAAGLPRAKISLRDAVARYFPEVARDGLGDDEYLVFTASPEGDIVGHDRLRRAPDADRAASVPGHKIAVRGQEALMALRGIDEGRVRSVDRMVQPAGGVAPTPVTIVWMQLRAPGDDPGAMRMSSSDPDAEQGTPPTPPRQFSAWTWGDGTGAVVSAAGTSGTMPSDAELDAAMDRFYTPAMRAAGIRGQVAMRFRLAADGSAAEVVVMESDNPALEPVARSVLGDLRFAGKPAGTEVRMSLGFGAWRNRTPSPSRSPKR